MKQLVGLIILGLVAWAGFKKYETWSAGRIQAAEEPAISTPVARPSPSRSPASSQFRCDGRTHCSQMTSCAEATYFLQNCPGTKMDGNNDGVPCERQWCK